MKDLKLSISLARLLILLRSKFFLYFLFIIFHNLAFMVTLRQIINCWFCKMVDQNHDFILFVYFDKITHKFLLSAYLRQNFQLLLNPLFFGMNRILSQIIIFL